MGHFVGIGTYINRDTIFFNSSSNISIIRRLFRSHDKCFCYVAKCICKSQHNIYKICIGTLHIACLSCFHSLYSIMYPYHTHKKTVLEKQNNFFYISLLSLTCSQACSHFDAEPLGSRLLEDIKQQLKEECFAEFNPCNICISNFFRFFSILRQLKKN